MDKKKQLRTPLIKPRNQGGTFYTFGSALEDIGLNINELNNKVVLSHYVLLDLPAFDESDFNTRGSYDDREHASDYIFAEGFQDYVLNMEAAVRNHAKYDFTNSITVSERVFWKWLIKSELMRVVPDVSNGVNTGYYVEEDPANSVVKCFGYINSGAQRSDDYSMYNETFVQVPSSFGQMKILFKVTEDDNYYADSSYVSWDTSDGYIENIDIDSETTDGILNKTGISAFGIFDDPDNLAYNVTEDSDLLTVNFSLDSFRKYYANEHITYDDMAMRSYNSETNYTLSDNFDFNAALIYYSIYDSTGKNILATNAYGLLLFNNSDTHGGKYKFETLNKKASTLTMSGTSYSFRLNIKASSVYSGDITVDDNSTPAYSMATDFNDTVKNLYTAINILRSNANLTAAISSDYRNLKNLTIEAIEKADQAEKEVTELKNGKFKKLDSSTLHAGTIVVGDGIDIAEGGRLQNQGDSGVLFTIGAIDSSYINTHYENTDMLRVDTVVTPNSGVVFAEEADQEEIAKVDREGISAKNLMIKQDSLPLYITLIDPNVINEVIQNIDVRRDAQTGALYIYVQPGAQGIAGDILANLYDEETQRLNLRQLLALLLAKIKIS